jgi:hypothetical protein
MNEDLTPLGKAAAGIGASINRWQRLGLQLRALTKLVRAEYPEDLSLAEIAATWGSDAGLTPEEIQAFEGESS